MHRPKHIDLKKDQALTLQWADGRVSVYPIAYLRQMSPCAESKQLRDALAENPLTVLPAKAVHQGPLTATDAQLVGHYAIRLIFSDGHRTGLYTWDYLREIDPNQPEKEQSGT